MGRESSQRENSQPAVHHEENSPCRKFTSRKDIRRFFSPVNKSEKLSSVKRKQNVGEATVIDSDEEDPIPSKTKKSRILASDSDDEIFEVSHKKRVKDGKKTANVPTLKNTKTKPIPKLQRTTPAEFFGSRAVSQSKLPTKRKIERAEGSCHEDSNFEDTLNQLDEQSKAKSKKLKGEFVSLSGSIKERHKDISASKNLNSKLASKVGSIKERHEDISASKNLSSKLASKVGSIKERHEDISASKNLSSSTKVKEVTTFQDVNSPNKKSASKDGEEKCKKIGSSQKLKSPSLVEGEKSKEETDENGIPVELERRKQNAAAYRRFLQRGGPKNLGGKPMPEGRANCLLGRTFIVTGVLDTIDREDAIELIKRYGGKVTTSLSKNTSYIVVGDEPGESKIRKAKSLGTKQLNEDELFALIADSSPETERGNTSTSSVNKRMPTASTVSPDLSKYRKSPRKLSSCGAQNAQHEVSQSSQSSGTSESPLSAISLPSMSPLSQKSCSPSSFTQPLSSQDLSLRSSESLMWVDKYRPVSLKNVIGQQGERSNAKKLVPWLRNWFSNLSKNKITKPSLWSKDGSCFKAALLSGPPGVGKTTTAHLACKELDFTVVEMNASDSRSKRSLSEEVTVLLSNKCMAGGASGSVVDSLGKKHVLIMDEVDGMSGNEDRGGVQELIALIKSSKVPILCICNDRNHPKIRSLSNYCFDLRFSKPRLEQIRGAMMSVCFREGIKIQSDALDDVIVGSNQDVRQVLHHLSMWSVAEKTLASEQIQKDAKMAQKEFKLGPWDVVRKVFTEGVQEGMTIHDKISLFFHDYSIGPLFVQENYLKVLPHSAKGDQSKMLYQFAKTASVLSDSDLIDKAIRSQSAWVLLPTQAVFSSLLPGEYLKGHFSGQIEFPRWLGNNSRKNKFDRIAQELHTHMRLRTSGSKQDIISDYSYSVRDAICHPLVNNGLEGVKESVLAMTSHDLIREDFDSLIELTTWPGMKNYISRIESKVKAVFTRSLNKDPHLNPFSTSGVITKAKINSEELDGNTSDTVDDEDKEEEDDISKDAMIKVGKNSAVNHVSDKDTSSKVAKGKGGRSKVKKT